MRIRSTKPEFWASRRIAAVDWEARLVLKGLESYVDDNGVGKDDVELIVADVFKRDLSREPSRTLARVSEAITRLHRAGLVWRYVVEEERLLFISCWESVQRIDKPGKGRFPRPDGTSNYGESEIRECVASPRETSRALAPGTGEQRNRGTGEQGAEIAPLSVVISSTQLLNSTTEGPVDNSTGDDATNSRTKPLWPGQQEQRQSELDEDEAARLEAERARQQAALEARIAQDGTGRGEVA